MKRESDQQRYPDYSSCNGQVATWVEYKDDGTLFFEVISNPATFRTTVWSPGNPENISLYKPVAGQRLLFTYVDERGRPLARRPVILDSENPCMAMHENTRAIMDATSTTALGDLAYTCFCKNV